MKPFIIPIFIPNYGCPNQCIYCDQNISVGQESLPTTEEVSDIIDKHLRSASSHSKPLDNVQVAFYGGTFTGLPSSTQENYLKSIAPYLKKKKVHSIRLSTRPDYISEENIALLKNFSVKTIELGIQSMDKVVLGLSQRGYTAEKVEESANIIKTNGLELGIQLMPGLPGDSEEKIMNTVQRTCNIKPDFARVYPAVVLKNTLLEKLYQNGGYTPLFLNEAVEICKKMLLLFQSYSIPVIRMGLQPTESLLKKGTIVAGPFHPAFKELVSASIFYDRLHYFINKKVTDSFTSLSSLTFSVHPSELSKFIGNKKENVKKLNKEFPGIEVRFMQNSSVQKGEFEIVNCLS